jgi:hypothetical protein
MNESRHASLHLDNLHEVLAASPDGASKGTMQFETPAEIARCLSLPLPRRRPIVTDLQCGHGALLQATANLTTEHHFGVDIDPTAAMRGRTVIVGNICEVFPLMQDVGLKLPLLALNPPFGLRWPATNLPRPKSGKGRALGSFSTRRLAEPHLDSTYATWLMAHQLLTSYGEGFLIGNAATLQRVIGPCPLADKIWWWLTLPNFFPDAPALENVAVLYFAADHRGGAHFTELQSNSTLELEAACAKTAARRHQMIRGTNIDRISVTMASEDADKETDNRFRAVKREWERRQAEARGEHGDWNIYLKNGRIAIYLTPFQNLSGQVSKQLAEALYKLRGRTPLELMVMRDTRVALEEALQSKIWRVDPALMAAMVVARASFEDVRTPFRRPALAQRVGWLDEQDTIRCLHPWKTFDIKESYALKTVTFIGKKAEWRDGKDGQEEVLVTGQEIAILIHDGTKWHAFTYHPVNQRQDGLPGEIAGAKHFHGLRELLDHFVLPDVPDLAMRQPERYAENLRRLESIEAP